MDADILNGEQIFAYYILISHLLNGPEEQFAMIVTRGPGNGKSTMIKAMCNRLNDIYPNTNSVQHTTLSI